MKLPPAAEWALGALGWIISTAASIGFLRGVIRGIRDAIVNLDMRLRALELPDRAITRSEFEARQRELFEQLGRLAREMLKRRRERG